MSENEDLKPESTTLMTLRVSPEHSKKFKELSKELSTNHAELFSSLINAFELDQAKMILRDREKEIAAFETTAKTLVSMFIHSLEVNQSMEEKIRTEFRVELDASTQTINNLHDQLHKSNQALEAEKLIQQDRNKKYEAINIQLSDKQLQLDLYASQLADKSKEIQEKDKRVLALEKMLENQHEELDTLKASLKDLPKIKMELQELSNQNFKYGVQVENLEQKLDLANETLKRRETEFKNMENFYKTMLKQKSDDYQHKVEEIKELKESLRRLEVELEKSEHIVKELQNSEIAKSGAEETPVEEIKRDFPVNDEGFTSFCSPISDQEDDDFEFDFDSNM